MAPEDSGSTSSVSETGNDSIAMEERPWDDSFTDVEKPPRIAWGDRLAVELHTGGSDWIVCEIMPAGFCIECFPVP